MRRFTEYSDQIFKHLMHPKTHMLHLDEDQRQDKESPLISLYVTALYILSLFQAKQVETFEEGFRRLTQLLAFQLKDSHPFAGAFPKYLHLFPQGIERKHQVKMLVVLDKIERDFGSLIKGSLKLELQQSLLLLKGYVSKNLESLKLDPLTNTIYSSYEAFHQESSLGFLDTLNIYDQDQMAWKMILAGCYGSISYYQKVVKEMMNLYHGPMNVLLFHSSVYKIGNRSYKGLCGLYAEYLVKGSATHLNEASLLEAVFLKEFDEETLQSFKTYQLQIPEHKNSHYLALASEDFAVLAHHHEANASVHQDKGLHLFQVYLKKEKEPLHLTCQSSHIGCSVVSFEEGCLNLELTYPQDIPRDGLDQVECDIYLDGNHQKGFFVENTKALICYFGEIVSVTTPFAKCDIELKSDDEGDLLGQISRGNRPSQMIPTSHFHYEAYDWKLSLRTLRRASNYKVSLSLQLHSFQDKKDESLEALDCLQMIP